MDAAKVKKLEEYAAYLKQHAESEESNGNPTSAVKDYVKLVDVLLLLANEAKDHNTWLKYTTQAESYQKKAKAVVSAANSDESGSSQEGKAGALKRIFGLKPESQKQEGYKLAEEQPHIAAQPVVRQPQQPQVQPRPIAAEETVPISQYNEVLKKNRELQSRLESMVEKSEYASLEARYRDLQSKMESMVERSEYDSLEERHRALEEKMDAMVPRSQYDELRDRLAHSVPRIQYEELQKTISNLVSRETYNSALARINRLESQLESSVPRSVLENLATEISFLTISAALPLQREQETESPECTADIGATADHVTHQVSERNEIKDELTFLKERIHLLELKSRVASVYNDAGLERKDFER